MRHNKLKFIVFFLILLYPSQSFAYFDPGTAAFIIQSIIAFLGSVIIFLTNPIESIKRLFAKLKKIRKEKKNENSKFN